METNQIWTPLECSICLESRKGMALEECEHGFCKKCLRDYIKDVKAYPVTCPFGDEEIICDTIMSDDLCYQILSKNDHALYNKRRLVHRCFEEGDLYPCYNPDCQGTVKLNENQFQHKCLRCGAISCYKCIALHENEESCENWTARNQNAINLRAQQKLLNEKRIDKNEAVNCMKCGMFLEYTGGCDWICCPCCQHEICFRTKMSRWGPKGKGDISGGCRCLYDGVTKCHPDCNNCH